jgi:hypothetical protein
MSKASGRSRRWVLALVAVSGFATVLPGVFFSSGVGASPTVLMRLAIPPALDQSDFPAWSPAPGRSWPADFAATMSALALPALGGAISNQITVTSHGLSRAFGAETFRRGPHAVVGRAAPSTKILGGSAAERALLRQILAGLSGQDREPL